MRKYISLFIVVAAMSFLVYGCGKGNNEETNDGREQVTIALWSDQLTEQYGSYLRRLSGS